MFSDCLFDQIHDSFTDFFFFPSYLTLGLCLFLVFNVLYCVADVPHAWCDASGSQT